MWLSLQPKDWGVSLSKSQTEGRGLPSIAKNMNRYTLILTFLLAIISLPSLGVDANDLVERDGLIYKKFSNVPYTGKVNEKNIQGYVKNGKPEGEYVLYHDNGQLNLKGTYKNGKRISD